MLLSAGVGFSLTQLQAAIPRLAPVSHAVRRRSRVSLLQASLEQELSKWTGKLVDLCKTTDAKLSIRKADTDSDMMRDVGACEPLPEKANDLRSREEDLRKREEDLQKVSVRESPAYGVLYCRGAC